MPVTNTEGISGTGRVTSGAWEDDAGKTTPRETAPRKTGGDDPQPYILRIANSTICSTAFASNTMRCSPSMSTTKP